MLRAAISTETLLKCGYFGTKDELATFNDPRDRDIDGTLDFLVLAVQIEKRYHFIMLPIRGVLQRVGIVGRTAGLRGRSPIGGDWTRRIRGPTHPGRGQPAQIRLLAHLARAAAAVAKSQSATVSAEDRNPGRSAAGHNCTGDWDVIPRSSD